MSNISGRFKRTCTEGTLFIAQGVSNNYDTRSSEFNDDGDDDDDHDDEQDTRSQLHKTVGLVRKRESP